MCSLVGRGERLRRQLVGVWELLLVAEVLLVTLLVYSRPVQTSVLLAKYLQGFRADCSFMLLHELSRRPKMVGDTQYVLGDSPAHLSPYYSSHKQYKQYREIHGIPDTGEEEEKTLKVFSIVKPSFLIFLRTQGPQNMNSSMNLPNQIREHA